MKNGVKNVAAMELSCVKGIQECLEKDIPLLVTNVCGMERLIGLKKQLGRATTSSIPMPVSTSANLKLEEGEMICDKCDGRGTIPNTGIPKGEISTASFCRKCQRFSNKK